MTSLVEYDANLPVEADSTRPSAEADDGGLQTNLLALAWQARWLILLTVLTAIGVSWAILQRVVPRYTSVSRIYVERNLPQILDNGVQGGREASYLHTQAELIRSTPVLAAAVNALGNAKLDTFRTTDNGVGLLKAELNVEVGKQDDIINVRIELPIAEDAAQIVNSVVDAYISRYAEKRRTDTVEVLNILRDEKQRQEAELAQRVRELEEFRTKNTALAVQLGGENVITKRFATLASELDRARLEQMDAKARLIRTNQMLESPKQREFLLGLASNRQTASQDIRLENQLQLDFEKQLQHIQLELNSLRANWGDGHTRVRLALDLKASLEKRLADQKVAIEERKSAVIAAYGESVAHEYQVLEEKSQELQRRFDEQFELAKQVSTQRPKMATLVAALARTESMVVTLDGRIKELNLTEDVGAMNVSIMEVAVPSLGASYPIRARFLAVGALLGGLIGFGLAWLRDLMDHRLKSIDEISATLGLPVLGSLPLADGISDRNLTGRVVLTKPRSVSAESFRTLRTAIHFGLTRDEAKIIAVTSPSSGDGKSTVASNLAITMAQADQRVLLIDADMRKPKQHEIFALKVEHGLSSVLSERRPAAEVIQKTELSSLEVLPCGSLPTNPVELLNNGYFSELLHELLETYDKILIDAPPIMPVADARVICAQTDATIIVLRAERSTRRLSVAARDELWRVRAQRLGVVVNGVPNQKRSSYASGYGYGYGGYGQYGYGGGTYGDLAYGEAAEPPANGELKKSRALVTQPPPAEEVEVVDS